MATSHVDPRHPVIVGVGQLNQRVDQGAPELEPIDLMARAVRLAIDDADTDRLVDHVDSVRVPHVLTWRYGDPGRLLAERLGVPKATTTYTHVGGNVPQMLANGAARDISDGLVDVVVITGAESSRSRKAYRRAGTTPDWTPQGDDVAGGPDNWGNEDVPLIHAAEMGRGLGMPVQIYPMFQSAWRAAHGWSIDDDIARTAKLWSRFSEIAAANPHAWYRTSYTPEQLASGEDGNRLIGFPYRRLLNSNDNVDQGAAFIMMAAEKAESLGISRDRWVFSYAGTDASETQYVSNRPTLVGSAAIRIAGGRALELAGVDADDLSLVDLYSCFPVAVEVAAAELGLGDDRDLTVTGGLSFAGGPWSNYVTHSIATMVEQLREKGGTGFISANGGYLTKHAFGVYGTEPPRRAFAWDHPQDQVDAIGSIEVCESFDGPVSIEAYTVMHNREDQPEMAAFAVRLEDGRRAWGTSRDPATMASLKATEGVGRAAELTADGTVTI